MRAYRQAPTPARRAAVESYAAAHPKEAPQARLALGVVAYERKDYAAAIANLRQAGPKLPQIADYTAYYLAAARVESNDLAGVAKDLAPVHAGALPRRSPARHGWWKRARSRPATPRPRVRLLRDHYAELPQPEGDATLADCYQAAGDLADAADFYQRIYYQYLTGDAATRAAAALLALKDAMGAAYPEPLPQQMLRRADRLLEAQLYSQARAEYQAVARSGAAARSATRRACVWAKPITWRASAAQAYTYLRGPRDGRIRSRRRAALLHGRVRAAARANDGDMMAAVQRLARALSQLALAAEGAGLGRQPLPAGRTVPDDYIPLYQAAYPISRPSRRPPCATGK